MSHPTTRAEAMRLTFIVMFIVGLASTAFLVVRVFLAPLLWAIMATVAGWPMLLRLQRLLWNRRSLATLVMTLLLLLVVLIPLVLAVVAIVSHASQLESWARSLADLRVDEGPPAWLLQIPVLGGLVQTAWQQLAEAGMGNLLSKLAPYIGDAARTMALQISGAGLVLVQSLVTVVIAAMLFLNGDAISKAVRGFAHRLAGERGESLLDLSIGAIRGVALGVGGTAFIQALLGGIGLAIAGVPNAAVWMAVMFMLCIVQLGPLPVLVPATIWLFWTGHQGLAVFLAIVAAIVWALETVLRPILIRTGADLPMPLIFIGVIGGLLAFGLAGIFIGPLVLAIAYTLFNAWMAEAEQVLNG